MWAIFSFTFLECLSLQTAFRQQADYKLKNETVWQLHAKRLQQGILPFGGIDLVTAETKLSHPLRDTGKSGDFFSLHTQRARFPRHTWMWPSGGRQASKSSNHKGCVNTR